MQPNPFLALTFAALAAAVLPEAFAQRGGYGADFRLRVAHASDWNLGASDGRCDLRIWVDERARVELRGDVVVVRSESGQRSYDQGSQCSQPLPPGPVEAFHVVPDGGRGNIVEVEPPSARNGFTGAFTIDDPPPGGDIYQMMVAWHMPEGYRPRYGARY
jgi:hypothetical protein